MTRNNRQPKRKVEQIIMRNANNKITRSRLTETEAWGIRDMRSTTKKWIQLGQDQPLMLQTTPRENIMAQVYDMIKLHGRHHKHDREQWSLTYDALCHIFETKLPKIPLIFDSY